MNSQCQNKTIYQFLLILFHCISEFGIYQLFSTWDQKVIIARILKRLQKLSKKQKT